MNKTRAGNRITAQTPVLHDDDIEAYPVIGPSILSDLLGALADQGLGEADIQWAGSPDGTFAADWPAFRDAMLSVRAVGHGHNHLPPMVVVGFGWWAEMRNEDNGCFWYVRRAPIRASKAQVPRFAAHPSEAPYVLHAAAEPPPAPLDESTHPCLCGERRVTPLFVSHGGGPHRDAPDGGSCVTCGRSPEQRVPSMWYNEMSYRPRADAPDWESSHRETVTDALHAVRTGDPDAPATLFMLQAVLNCLPPKAVLAQGVSDAWGHENEQGDRVLLVDLAKGVTAEDSAKTLAQAVRRLYAGALSAGFTVTHTTPLARGERGGTPEGDISIAFLRRMLQVNAPEASPGF
ncbi:MAG: hypothetical protein U0974_11920 [Gemmatimonadales bacterium]|nr:hypothetical protein [Gemmatimonadales bacterium]